MVLKLIDATQAKSGTVILIDGEACTVKSNDKSKSGKHGAAKCRIEAIGIFSGKKKIMACPGSERFDVPNVEKRKGQILSVSEEFASVMDMESFETIDLTFIEDLRGQLAAEQQIEYWDVEGEKKIMRIL